MAIAQHEPTIATEPLFEARRNVVHRLHRVRRQLRTHLVVEGVFVVVSAAMLLAALSFVLDRFGRFHLPTRQALLIVGLGSLAFIAVRRFGRPLLLDLEDLDVAELLDRRTPGVGQQISNVLQLPDLLRNGDGASEGMVHATITNCAHSLSQVDFARTINTSRQVKLLIGCAGWLLLALAVWFLWPAATELWARRWFAGSNVRWPQDTYLTVLGLEDADTLVVPRGEMSLVQIGAKPTFVKSDAGWLLRGRGEPLVVESAEAPSGVAPERVSVAYRSSDGTRYRGNAVQFEDAMFRYELVPLADPIELVITGGDDWLGPIRIEPIDRPAVKSLDLFVQSPGDPERRHESVGDGTSQYLYLQDSQLELKLVANQPLESAEVFDGGTPVSGWQRLDEQTYSLRWTMSKPLSLEFRLTGQRGALTSKPTFLTIGLLKDREPRVMLRSSGVGRRITSVARIPLTVRAADDFGVTSLGIDLERTQVRDDKPQVRVDQLPIEQPGQGSPNLGTELELDHELALAERELGPGDLVKLYATAIDNCALGKQSGKSRALSFQVVSPEELFYEILTRQREQRAKFTAALEMAKSQDAALEKLATRDEAIAVARAEAVISRQVWQVANILDGSLQEMTLNDLGNPQAREILQSGIIAPLRTLHGDLLSRLRASVDQLAAKEKFAEGDRDEAKKVSEQSLEAMQAILAQMSQWESFVDVINQLKQVIQRQTDVLKTTEELKDKRTDALFDP